MLAENYLPVAVVALVGILFPVVILLVGRLFRSRPYKSNPVKYEPYECGEIPIGDTRINFGVNYYLYALIFVVFDVETVFLFPWAVSLVDLGVIGFIEMVLFVFILLVGLAYAWRTGVLEWRG